MPPKRTRQATAPADGERAAKKTKTADTRQKEAEKAPKAAPKKTAPVAQTVKKTTAAKKTAVATKKPAPAKAAMKKPATKKVAARPKAASKASSTAPSEPPKSIVVDEFQAPVLKNLKELPLLNTHPYTKPLDVFVFGEGSNGELGLGSAKGQMDVKRPRFNKLLADKKVVRVAAGGMHVVALTQDNKILTWGVNDQGALGRDTKWEAPLKDIDADDSDSSSNGSTNGLNPRESTPTEIASDRFHTGAKFVDVIAGDSSSFALTDQGRVYGWGTFRSNEGILGFTPEIQVQRQPLLFDKLKNIVKIACGANHVLALDKKGVLYGFGAGQQHQLARQIVQRFELQATVPTHITIKEGRKNVRIKDMACGSYHSFAIAEDGRVFSWGLNNYAQCGIHDDIGSDQGSVVKTPTWVTDLTQTIRNLEGGGHHSVAVTDKGDVLAWGRCDGHQTGLDLDDVPDSNKVFPIVEEGATAPPRRIAKVVKIPTKLGDVEGKASMAAAGHDHGIAITEAGRAFSWGFSANYQTGQGHDDDVEVATLIDNTATRDRKLVWAGAGGQYSIVAAYTDDVPMVNGTS